MANPILIVGAGPVGLTMASTLAHYGLDFRIIDKAARRPVTSRRPSSFGAAHWSYWPAWDWPKRLFRMV